MNSKISIEVKTICPRSSGENAVDEATIFITGLNGIISEDEFKKISGNIK